MKDQSRTNQELLEENSSLKKKIHELEHSESGHNQAEETFRASEEKYRIHFENASDIIFSYDREFRILSISPSLERVLGYKPEEFIGKSFPDLNILSSRYLDKALSDAMRVFSGEHLDLIIYEFIARDGTIKYGEISSSPLLREGKVVAVVSVARDITERKRIEKELVRLKQQYELILSSAVEGILGLDLQGNHIFVNPSAAGMLGYEADELLGCPSHSTWHHTRSDGSHFPQEECEIHTANREGVVNIMSNDLFWRKDGISFPVRFTSTTIYDKDSAVGVVITFMDITERKKAEEALRESENKFRAFAEQSLVGIYLVQNGVLKYVNPKFAEIFGYTVEECSHNMLFRDLVYPADYVNVKEQVRKRLSGEIQSVNYSFRGIKKTGEINHVEIFGSTIKIDGRPTVTGTILDITDRKRTEKELLNTLESLRRAVNTTIQVMVSAVDVRDPYTAGHQVRVADLARAIATEMGLSQDRIEAIRMAGPIHDIGKLAIPAEILSKPGKLSAIEFSLVKEHARTGYEMLKDVETPWPLAQIVYQHHERMDGSGYPNKLKGEDIIMEARSMSVADVVESMASHRPYRSALGINAALEEIENNRGTLYDADVADACLRLFREKGFQIT